MVLKKMKILCSAIVFFVAAMLFYLPSAGAFCMQHGGEDICFSVPDELILTGRLLADKPMPTVTKYLKYFWLEAIYEDETVMFCVLVDINRHRPVGAFIQYMGPDAWPYAIYYTWNGSGGVVLLEEMGDLEETIKEYKEAR